MQDKLKTEAQKLLGSVNSDAISFQNQSVLKISAGCNVVAALDGHMVCLSLHFRRRLSPRAHEVKDTMRKYVSEAQKLGCPSALADAICVFDEGDQPQPRLDRDLRGTIWSVWEQSGVTRAIFFT